MKTFLHVGCGKDYKDKTTVGFNTTEWNELRFDIDETANPDIVGNMLDMSMVASESVDAVFSSHNIEHLYPHEVPQALNEFYRVLKPEGFLVLTCPDLQSICALVAQDKLTEPAYMSPSGPIAPIDVLYGHRPSLMRGNHHMAHRCGFTKTVLVDTLLACHFRGVISKTLPPPYFDLWALASKSDQNEDNMRAMAMAHFP